jgi:hypothetical protein
VSTPHKQTRFGWRALRAAIFGVLTFILAGIGHAFSYNTGDLVGVFVGGSELIVDLGPLSQMTNGETITFATPVSFGFGSRFLSLESNAPFNGQIGRNVTFTTATTVNPTIFDNNISHYVTKIAGAQVSLDNGLGASAGGWLPLLPHFPPAGLGGVIVNDATRLLIPATESSSYTNVIGLSTDQINGKLPFSIAASLVGSTPTVLDLWKGVQASATTSRTTELGTLTVNGDPTGSGTEVQITFNAVPEPTTAGLVAVGLGVLSAVRKRRLIDS